MPSSGLSLPTVSHTAPHVEPVTASWMGEDWPSACMVLICSHVLTPWTLDPGLTVGSVGSDGEPAHT